MGFKYTTKSFCEKANKVHGGYYDLSLVEYTGIENKITVICPKHGEFNITASNFLQGHGCAKCYHDRQLVENKGDLQEFILKARQKHGDKYDYSRSTYINAKTKLIVICPTHGEFEVTPNNHLKGSGCPYCAGRCKTSEDLIKKFHLVHGDTYDYSKVDIKNKDEKGRVCIICKEHGEFWQTPHNHLKGKGCKKCAKVKLAKKFAMTLEDFLVKAKSVHGDKYDYSKVTYVNANTPIEIICPKHGKFFSRPSDHFNGGDCPVCACGNTSKTENDIICYVQSVLNIDNIKTKDRTVLDGLEIDILVPHLRIGIEYDGLHWHSEEQGKDRNYHLNKTLIAESKGYHLIHVFEDEWLEHKDLVKDKICHMLNKDVGKIKIGARKCCLKKINVTLAKPFLEKYHIQGWAPSSIYYGAFYDNKLVGVMSFLQESRGKWNLTRFSTDINYAIPGLATKLFKHFVDDYNNGIDEIKTFLDRRWSWADVNVYDRMGFKLAETLKPNYHYVRGQKRYHKFGFRKQILHKKYGLPLAMSESEMVKQIGLDKIWDCGLFKYVWENSQQS